MCKTRELRSWEIQRHRRGRIRGDAHPTSSPLWEQLSVPYSSSEPLLPLGTVLTVSVIDPLPGSPRKSDRDDRLAHTRGEKIFVCYCRGTRGATDGHVTPYFNPSPSQVYRLSSHPPPVSN